MKKHFLLWVALVFAAQMIWGVDQSYYSTIEGSKGSNLRDKLYTITAVGPTNMSYDGLWNAYKTTDVYPSDSVGKAGKIWDMYSNVLWNPGEKQCGNYSDVGSCYNREHSLPKSWFNEKNPAYYDLGHIVPTDGYVNNQRSNYPFGECAEGTRLTNGSYRATGKLGNSTFAGYTTLGKVFEPDDEYKGDFARMYMYMIVRYKKGNSSSITFTETSNGQDMFNNTDENFGFTNYSVSLLMKWHRLDKVSRKEVDRNNGMETKQGNRNPFIDYPILAEYLWGKYAGETFNLENALGSFEAGFTPGVSDGDKQGSSVDPTPTPIPADYYLPVEGLKDSLLKSRLAEITWSHYTKVYTYGSGSNNRTWAAFWYTDRNETDNSVIDMYSNNKRYFNPDNKTASVTDCDIEHMFPNSWFGGEDGNQHAYCDLNHLVPADYSANRSKGNAGPGLPTDSSFNNGVWVNGKDANRGNLYVFCPPDEYKGDFARAYFYVATTYGDTAIWQTDNAVPHMTNDDWHEFLPETRDLLLKWHREDPVSEKELIRNNTVYGLQGNRNPFIDYPCLAEYIWGTMQGEEFDLSCSDLPTTKHTITWSVNGVTSSNQVIADLQPTAPSVDDCSTDRVFVGWTTSAVVDSKPDVLYKSSEIPNATAPATYYAVFADKEGEGTGSDYVLFNGTLTEGNYIIYYGGKAMKAEVSSNRFAYSEVSAVNNTISSTDESIVWHIAPSGDYWTIYSAKVKQYAAGTGASNKAQLLASGTDDKSLWTVSDKYDFTNKYNAANSANAILRNNGTYGFACYSSQTGKALSLYKAASTVSYSNYGLLCEECTPVEPSASFASSTKSTTCDGSVSNALNKGGSEGAVTYTSSKTDVATVNANTGAVTIKKVGTTTITANIAEAGCYTATSTSYTLTVNAKASTTTFTNPTTSLEEADAALNGATTTSDGTIVYASNNTAVATVNASTGVVTAVKPGTARITASVAATDCYAESSAYYDLTVTAIPTYTVTWKANGATVQTDEVKKGTLYYSLPDDPDNCSEDRVFKGWTVEKNYEDATSAPEDMFNSPFAVPVLTKDTTIYAVYADKKTTPIPGEMIYTQVTNTGDLEDGKYLIVYTASKVDSVAFDGSLTELDVASNTIKVSITDNTIAGSTDVNATTFTIKATSEAYTIQSASGFYIGQTTDANGLARSKTEKHENSISFDNGNAVIVSSGGAYLRYNKTSGQTRFRYFKSGTYASQQPIQLYKQTTISGGTETTYINYSTKCPEVYDFKALAATEVTHNSFMANWTESGGDYYTLDVTRDVKKEQAGTTVFDKNFTESLEGWTINNVSGYENVWTHSTSYGAYATSYKDKVRNAAESWLLSPNIDLKDVTAPSLTLNHVFRYGTTVSLNIKEESAVEWNELSPTNWSAASSWDFINSVADLSSYAGKTIQIGFKYIGTTEENKCPTWEIKRITITGTAEVDDLESIDGYPQVIYNTSALVSGLDPKTTYYYTVTAEDGTISNRIEVTTLANDEPTDTENVLHAPEVRKLLINGQLFILRDGKIYTIQGARVQ